MGPMRFAMGFAGLALALLPGAAAAACPLPGQSEMLVTRLYFGQSVGDRGAVTAGGWRLFLAQTVTPRFPQGFTVTDAQGQWRDPKTRRIGRENSKVVEIAAPDTPAARARIGEIAQIYRAKFHQQSVGIVTTIACGLF